MKVSALPLAIALAVWMASDNYWLGYLVGLPRIWPIPLEIGEGAGGESGLAADGCLAAEEGASDCSVAVQLSIVSKQWSGLVRREDRLLGG